MKITNDNINDFFVKVNEVGFGKPISEDESIRYSLYVSFESILERFSEYFNDFMEREADDPDPDEYLNGVYLRIKNAGFPELKKILDTDLELFCQLITEELSSEFLGYILKSDEKLEKKSIFVVQSLNSLKVNGQQVFCEGIGYQISR
ncbi:hypothetical protein HQQ94_17815 [Shewanella sp. VB17]|uniref:hypothetical protein n=1 Tax=Shewanella sp. VB17 TaxID=2739432 RepID=UPI001564196B|nr:hypothetical protein [Shewanella sp. VB17]NRD75039.1 hypothetical protein [Shewanella sp. VB17]